MAYDPYASSSSRLSHLTETTRRQFLLLIGAIGAVGALLFGGIQSLKFLFPGAVNEAPAEFKVSRSPASIAVGDAVQDTAHRVTVIRDDAGFYAVYLVCTHLGCTPNYATDVASDLGIAATVAELKARGDRQSLGANAPGNGWKCPCHGSRYFIDSTNFYGPAPRPMDWVKIKYGLDGGLIVDRSSIVVERGSGVTTPPQWRLPALKPGQDPASVKDNGKTIP